MKIQARQIADGQHNTQSVLECGSSTAKQSARRLAQSKTWRNIVTGFALLLSTIIIPPSTVHAQSYSVDWYKISGGGGTSTGGTYQVSGTIGQPDASGAMSGGNYSVTGGFWSLIQVVQTPGTPLLTITHVGNQVIVSWDSSATGWTLQINSNLAAGTWGNYLGTIVNNSVTNAPLVGNLFFRLKH